MSKKIGRRDFLENCGKAAIALAASGTLELHASQSLDLLFKGANILDGTGSPSWKSDLGIVGDSIVALGSISSEQAKRVVDVSGLYLAPGFVDIHSHSDFSIAGYPTADSRVRQGITTEITGNCGSSAAPLVREAIEEVQNDWMEEGDRPDWSDIASYFTSLEKRKVSVNQALLVGQGTLRENLIGSVDRKVTAEELKALLRNVEEAMDAGAVGISTGLEYTPGIFTPTEELVEMVRVVARYGGLYATHSRNEEARLLEAVNEAIDIGRRTGIRVEISHLKACGKVNWRLQQGALDLIESARADGVQVSADAYPYTAYSTGLTVLLEAWVRDGGSAAILQRLRDLEQRARIRKELDHHIVDNEPGGYDLIVISDVNGDKNRSCIGKNILQIAETWKTEPVDAFLRLLEEEETSVSYVGHGMSPENVEKVLSNPLVMIGSDGYSMSPAGKALLSRPHPRSYGAYARLFGYYVRERRLFDLPTAVKKMTSMPADQVGLRDRGRIAPGKKADLVVLNPDAIKDHATFEDPQRYPDGIHHVLVNGVFVVENSKHTGARPGRILRRV